MTETKSNTNTVKKIILGLAIFVLILVLCPMTTVQAEEQLVEVGIPVEEHPELFLTRSMPTHGEGKIAVFLIQFPDYMNDDPMATQEYYDKLYFSGGIHVKWGSTYVQTVADFFDKHSYGKLQVSGQVFDWYTTKHERSYYDNRKDELIAEVSDYYRAQGVDFSGFDGDGDGIIDAVAFHFSGDHTTARNTPWYPGLCIYQNGQIGEMKFTTIVQVPVDTQSNALTTICHELMHTLGMNDLYSEVYAGMSPLTDHMSSGGIGCVINPYTKILLGWIDSVKVITEDTADIRLDEYSYKSQGDIAIVTDEYNGIFDEFYIVAYRNNHAGNITPVIWHVDARLNEDQTAFLCNNLYYDPRPDKDNPHGISNPSPYLFIEELSSDSETNYVLHSPGSPEYTAFGKNSMLGPNSLPSSDTHDGKYTGIQIYNFEEHNEQYLTFDVSFAEDSAAPELVTQETELKFHELVSVRFNEFIYAGENWNDILITDPDGNPLDAKIILPNYPHNEVEITFHTDAYTNGYKIVFPAGSIQDSSGNKISALTLFASKENYIFSLEDIQLPNPGYPRDNTQAAFFHEGDSLVVITCLWESKSNGNNVPDAKIEFMRLDLDGNLLLHKIVDNPFENTYIGSNDSIMRTNDGSYVIFCYDDTTSESNCVFCIDSDGNLKWTNDENRNSNKSYFIPTKFQHKNTIAVRLIDLDPDIGRVLTHIFACFDISTGKIEETEISIDSDTNFFPLEGNRLLSSRSRYETNFQTEILILDTDTLEVLQKTMLNDSAEKRYLIRQVYDNGDGTLFLVCDFGDKREILLLDAELNVVKSVSRKKMDNSALQVAAFFCNDGFCDIELMEEGNHDNSTYHVRRYDRHLNLMWETDVTANFIYFFQSSSGDIMAYRSMWAPERECYIDDYGSEEKFRTQHVHTIEHREATSSTCASEGRAEHWYCTECGVYFSDNGETIVTDLNTFSLPLGGHTYGEWSTTEHATCTEDGVKTRKCLYCDDAETEAILANGEHSYGEWSITQNATCNEDGVKTRKCLYCDDAETETILANGEHSYGEWSITQSATCNENGIKTRKCRGCDATKTETIPATGVHSYGDWSVTKNATCNEDGIQTRKCRDCEATETEAIPSTDAHILGNWETTKYATCTQAGEERRACQNCDYKATREIRPTGKHEYGGWVITKEATCKTEGQKKRSCDLCGGTETQVIPANDQHLYGEWSIDKKAGEEVRTCMRCGAEEARAMPKDITPILVIAIGSAVALGGGAFFLIHKKRK